MRANVEDVHARIAQAAKRAGRDPAEVELLAAVKYVALDELGTLAHAGLTLLGREPRSGAGGEGGRLAGRPSPGTSSVTCRAAR